jgi:hypothetical protein
LPTIAVWPSTMKRFGLGAGMTPDSGVSVGLPPELAPVSIPLIVEATSSTWPYSSVPMLAISS